MTEFDKKTLILSEQTRLLYTALPKSLVASLINACLLAYILRNVVDHDLIIFWLVSVSLTLAIRGALYFGYRMQNPWPQTDRRWYVWNLVGVFVSAVAWGGAVLFIFPSYSVVHQAFLAFVVAGMTAGAMSTLAHSWRAASFYLYSMLPLLAIRFFMEDTEMGYAMGTMIVLYFIILYSSAGNNYKNIVQNIELRIESEMQKEALKESREKYYTIFESSPLGIMHFHYDGNVNSCNRMMCDMLGMSESQLHATNLLTIASDAHFAASIRQSLQGHAAQYEGNAKVLSPNANTPVRIYFRGIRDLDGNVSGGVAIVEDRTEDQRVNKLKSEFVSTVSHELRTPLTAISGSVGLMKNARQKISKTEFESLLENIERNSHRLLLLVNDILDIEKISSGSMDFSCEKTLIFPLINDAIHDNQPYANQFYVTFCLTQESKLHQRLLLNLDRQRFLQVMANLLSNAAKFSYPHSLVLVSLTVVDHLVRISITDSGEGVADDFKDKLFDKFTQQDSSDSRRAGGTGLGLSISKEIVERMNGKIHFESELNKGSTFYIDFPMT